MLAGKIKLEDWGNEQEWIKQYASRREKNTYGDNLECQSRRDAISEIPLGLCTKGTLAEKIYQHCYEIQYLRDVN